MKKSHLSCYKSFMDTSKKDNVIKFPHNLVTVNKDLLCDLIQTYNDTNHNHYLNLEEVIMAREPEVRSTKLSKILLKKVGGAFKWALPYLGFGALTGVTGYYIGTQKNEVKPTTQTQWSDTTG